MYKDGLKPHSFYFKIRYIDIPLNMFNPLTVGLDYIRFLIISPLKIPAFEHGKDQTWQSTTTILQSLSYILSNLYNFHSLEVLYRETQVSGNPN